MALIDALITCQNSAIRKNWDKIYIAIDIHDTVVKGNYKSDELPTDFLPHAKETLQMLSKHKNVVLILYTCSHPTEIIKYFSFFKENDIHFKYANQNPDVPDNALGCYKDKFYFNILLEDKAGFIAEDWNTIFDFFKHSFKI